jgi:hypothetical protein
VRRAGSNGGAGGGCSPYTPPWWDTGYIYRRELTVDASGVPALAAGYSVGLVWDSTGDVAGGRMLASGNDVRVVFWDGATNLELHRHLLAMDSGRTELWFKTQADFTGTSGAYWLYFGNPAPAAPLASWSDAMAGTSKVYLAADSFESYPAWSTLASVSSWVGSARYTVQLDPLDASNQVARVVGTGGDGAFLFNGSFGWTDIALRVRYFDQTPASQFMGFWLRVEDATPFHMLFAGYANPATQIQFWNCSLNAPTDTALASTNFFPGAAWVSATNDGTTWHEHLVRVRGTGVRHSVDGSEWFPAAYPTLAFNASTLPAAGRIGLCSGNQDGTAYVDDVVVRALVEPEPTVSAGADVLGCGRCGSVTCTAPDACHISTCSPATGACVVEPVAEGSACDDGDACTIAEHCTAGSCGLGSPIACPLPGDCMVALECDRQAGCRTAPKPDGSACLDPAGGVCQGGRCVQPSHRHHTMKVGCGGSGEPAALSAVGLAMLALCRRAGGRRRPG